MILSDTFYLCQLLRLPPPSLLSFTLYPAPSPSLASITHTHTLIVRFFLAKYLKVKKEKKKNT